MQKNVIQEMFPLINVSLSELRSRAANLFIEEAKLAARDVSSLRGTLMWGKNSRMSLQNGDTDGNA